MKLVVRSEFVVHRYLVVGGASVFLYIDVAEGLAVCYD